jgi:cytochrome c556
MIAKSFVRSAAVCLAIGLVGTSVIAWGQDRTAGAPRDIIMARKTLMSVIARNMYPLDEMIYTGKINLQRGRGHADSISAMLQGFLFLFPTTTNTWTPNAGGDIAYATFADPHIWEEFDFFSKQVQAATKYALDASRAEKDADFRKNVTELRLTCDNCHATFQKNN